MKDSWCRHEQERFSGNEKRCTQPCSMQPAFIAWWRNGKTVKNSSRRMKRDRKQGIERNGALLSASTDA